MGYPEGDSEREILRSEAGTAQLEQLRPYSMPPMLLDIQQRSARSTWMSADHLCAGDVRKTRESDHLYLGVSPRRLADVLPRCQAMAFLDGRDYCTPEDFKPLAVSILAHRVVVSPSTLPP